MILNSLHGNSVTESSDLVKCDNMNDFVRMFKQVSQEKGINQETIYIVSKLKQVVLSGYGGKTSKELSLSLDRISLAIFSSALLPLTIAS